MKKKFCILFTAVFIFSAQILFAQENDLKRFSFGGIWRADSLRSSGGTEFGVTISSGNFVVRNYILVEGLGLHKTELYGGGFSVADKIQLGAKIDLGNTSVISYGFAQVGGMLFSTSQNGIFENPVFIEFSFGGGFEFLIKNNFSFLVEYGGGGYIPSTKNKFSGQGFQVLVLGCRNYF